MNQFYNIFLGLACVKIVIIRKKVLFTSSPISKHSTADVLTFIRSRVDLTKLSAALWSSLCAFLATLFKLSLILTYADEILRIAYPCLHFQKNGLSMYPSSRSSSSSVPEHRAVEHRLADVTKYNLVAS